VWFLAKPAANTLQRTITDTNVQVAFSKKSVVLRTPIIWFELEKLDARPPPFEFCTNTINTKIIDATTARMVKNKYMLLNLFVVFMI